MEKLLRPLSSPAHDDVVDVRLGDRVAETAEANWLLEYAVSRDPILRERIILAYLGLADRLAARYRHSGRNRSGHFD